jgi:hypothetical protein
MGRVFVWAGVVRMRGWDPCGRPGWGVSPRLACSLHAYGGQIHRAHGVARGKGPHDPTSASLYPRGRDTLAPTTV